MNRPSYSHKLAGLSVFAEFEIAYKIKSKIKQKDLPSIRTSRDIYELAINLYSDEEMITDEKVFALYFNRSLKLYGFELISIGSAVESVNEPKKILRKAILFNASSIAIIHNHPSGNLRPSDADIKTTNTIKNVCVVHDIQLLDHLILCADESYFSFADEGLI